MSKTVKAICVWFDAATDDGSAWIVSSDTIDSAGRAETTRTISVHETEDEALEEGRKVAARRGLPLYANPENGPAVLLEAAPTGE